MADLNALDATALLMALDGRRISSVELLEASMARARQLKADINAVVREDVGPARQRAREIDERRAGGETSAQLGLLAGLPMTIKDCLDVGGMPASAGVRTWEGRSAADAVAVGRVRSEGAVIWGKTNVPALASDWQSYNPLYGTTSNPWDKARTAGGSSGGAAAALATGITPLEIGSDIGGSLRIPASFCGIYAHKPTYGLVPQRGHVPPAPGMAADPDLNVIGPMARSARDLRLLLSILAGGTVAAKAPAMALAGVKIGLWLDEPAFPLDPEAQRTIQAFADDLAADGVAIEAIESPVEAEALNDAYLTLLMPLIASGMPPAQMAMMRALRGPARLSLALGRPLWALQVLNATVSHADWLAANEVRARMLRALRSVFERYEAIIAPCAPAPAFPHDHRPITRRRLAFSDGRKIPYDAMLHWPALATVCGLPATAMPAGLTKGGLPVGVQIIGPRGGDSRTIAVAEAIEARLGGFRPPP